jgi:hypothetical protein
MTDFYRRLLDLYPADVAGIYSHEMLDDFANGLDVARRHGRIATARFIAKELLWLLCDAAAERAATLYSHQSFRGRRLPNPGQVRPPNMSKKEWYADL